MKIQFELDTTKRKDKKLATMLLDHLFVGKTSFEVGMPVLSAKASNTDIETFGYGDWKKYFDITPKENEKNTSTSKRRMNNVKLVKARGAGWFLTIGDDIVNNRWAVTSLELWTVKKIIQDNMDEIMQEIESTKRKEDLE